MAVEAFLINPPRRRVRKTKPASRKRYTKNPLGVEDLLLLNPPRKRRAKVARVRRARDSKGRFLKKGRVRRRKSTRRAVTHRRTVRTIARRSPRKRVRSLRRHSVYITNPRRSHRRRYHRNPSIGKLGFSMKSIVPTIKEGAFIALGAVAVTQAAARLPWFNVQVGPTKHVARLGLAILGGTLIGKYFNKNLGKAFAMGGVVTTALALGAEQFPQYVGPTVAELVGTPPAAALGMYYAEAPGNMALGEYYASGEVMPQANEMPGRLVSPY